jgi:hypothetical protein
VPICDAAAIDVSGWEALDGPSRVGAAAGALYRACALSPALKGVIHLAMDARGSFLADVDLQAVHDASRAWSAACPTSGGLDALFGERPSAVRAQVRRDCPSIALFTTDPEWTTAAGSWALPPLVAALLSADGWTAEQITPVFRALSGIGPPAPRQRPDVVIPLDSLDPSR